MSGSFCVPKVVFGKVFERKGGADVIGETGYPNVPERVLGLDADATGFETSVAGLVGWKDTSLSEGGGTGCENGLLGPLGASGKLCPTLVGGAEPV